MEAVRGEGRGDIVATALTQAVDVPTLRARVDRLARRTLPPVCPFGRGGFQKTCELGLQLLSWHRNLYLMR
jgi:hypothetical protein